MFAGIVIAAIEAQKIKSVIYFAAAAVLIFVAAMLAGRKVQRNLKAKWIATIFAVSMVTFGLIWFVVTFGCCCRLALSGLLSLCHKA